MNNAMDILADFSTVWQFWLYLRLRTLIADETMMATSGEWLAILPTTEANR